MEEAEIAKDLLKHEKVFLFCDNCTQLYTFLFCYISLKYLIHYRFYYGNLTKRPLERPKLPLSNITHKENITYFFLNIEE